MKKMILAAACALALAACGSSGGGSVSYNSSVSKGSSGSTGSSGAAPATARVQSGKNYFVVANGKQQLAFPDAAKIRKLNVNGVEFDLTDGRYGAQVNNGWRSFGNGLMAGQRPPAGVESFNVWVGSNNTTAGVITAIANGEKQRFAFFNGKPTDVKQLPSGRVVYDVGVVSTSPAGSFMTRSLDVTADFATKKVSANIERTAGNNGIVLNADIKGNRFESPKGAATSVQGGFFGNGAAEIGGVFANGQTVGAFVGKKK
ncbi:transferrin-binding protein-like solute binding protein [Conchiformibius kuhniae]|uniref:Transferrin-binding protein-like solute binding protein n=1 Tax=Conchiformibius kuhniae TaxID=211502 RepID=A0A8T9MTH6_9NEIS|nr:transferrin-binding protein-like solute binding protein [Conchiformibius kuhniae]UOP04561.1 transferrin-binding protein-like solute binding protein [Conchiformibius kuhniae]